MGTTLSNSDKYYIAEFLYSNATDILIKSDAEKAIEVINKCFTDEKIEMDASVILTLIYKHISAPDINTIMEDYYSGKL